MERAAESPLQSVATVPLSELCPETPQQLFILGMPDSRMMTISKWLVLVAQSPLQHPSFLLHCYSAATTALLYPAPLASLVELPASAGHFWMRSLNKERRQQWSLLFWERVNKWWGLLEAEVGRKVRGLGSGRKCEECGAEQHTVGILSLHDTHLWESLS